METSARIVPAAISKTLHVNASPETAFQVFTDGFDGWWPRMHSVGASPLVKAILEPGVGGRWFSLHENGETQPWGEVLAWEPPHRLVLAWRIDHDFGFNAQLLTEVEVCFLPVEGGTRVEFEHRHLDRFGDTEAAAETILSMDGGWGMILQGYREAAEGRASFGGSDA